MPGNGSILVGRKEYGPYLPPVFGGHLGQKLIYRVFFGLAQRPVFFRLVFLLLDRFLSFLTSLCLRIRLGEFIWPRLVGRLGNPPLVVFSSCGYGPLP